jgi:hypothetical protein
MKDLEEQHVCIKFCFKLAKTFTETFQMLKQAYGEDCLSRTQCYEWYQHFKSGRTSTEDDPKPGRLSTSMNDDLVEKVRTVIREVSEEVGISKSSCHTILTKKLEMHHVAAKFVPRLLTDEQKANCVTVSQELFDHSNAGENFLYGYDIETKAQLSQWVGKSSPRPKKACQTRSNV